jgi:hypothetical protein
MFATIVCVELQRQVAKRDRKLLWMLHKDNNGHAVFWAALFICVLWPISLPTCIVMKIMKV